MDFSAELKHVMQEGDLTIADLHHWFNRPRPTVRTWVKLDHAPRGPAGALAWERLRLLQHAVRYGVLPVSRELSSHERPRYIVQVRNGLERNRVPAGGAA